MIRLDDKTPLVNVFSMLNGVKSLHLYCGNTKKLKLLTVYIATFLGKHHNLRDGGGAPRENPYISRKIPYLSKQFYMCPFIFPKD